MGTRVVCNGWRQGWVAGVNCGVHRIGKHRRTATEGPGANRGSLLKKMSVTRSPTVTEGGGDGTHVMDDGG
jgi:hypothetical protein